jgi:hypothetical protein
LNTKKNTTYGIGNLKSWLGTGTTT